jgi:hypothetical protein
MTLFYTYTVCIVYIESVVIFKKTQEIISSVFLRTMNYTIHVVPLINNLFIFSEFTSILVLCMVVRRKKTYAGRISRRDKVC